MESPINNSNDNSYNNNKNNNRPVTAEALELLQQSQLECPNESHHANKFGDHISQMEAYDGLHCVCAVVKRVQEVIGML